jgi:hypothetical protein
MTNCGDFQLAHRTLWRRTRFPVSMEGRQFGDTFIQASWLNQGASLLVPHGVSVRHISHRRPAEPGSRTVQHDASLSEHDRLRNKHAAQRIRRGTTAEAVASSVGAQRDDNSTVFWNPEPRFVLRLEGPGAPRLENRGSVPIP